VLPPGGAARQLVPVPGSGTFCSLIWPRASTLPRSSVMVDKPQLLDTALLQGLGDNLGAARGSRAQEIGRIVHTDRELPPVPHRQAGAEAGGGFDGGGVDTAVHHAPRRVVIRPEVDVPRHAGSAGRIHNEAGCGKEPAGSLSAEIDAGVRAGLGIGSVLHDIVVAEDDYLPLR
jgi:hypothetical protein